jgi:hypothetical protein
MQLANFPTLEKGLFHVRDQLFRLSARERVAVILAGLLLVVFVSLKVWAPLKEHFVDQEIKLDQVRSDLIAIPLVFKQYFKLLNTKKQIEDRYRQVRRTEGVLSHLEQLVSEKTSLSQGLFSIQELPVQSFGGSYENHPFSVRLRSVGIKEAINLLHEVVEGAEPYLLTRLEINRRFQSDKLELTFEVSSISPK